MRSFSQGNSLGLHESTGASRAGRFRTDVISRYGNVNLDADSDSEDSSDSMDLDYEEEENQAPWGYMDPSDYRDTFGGSDHSDLEDEVWAARINNWPALWWKNPYEQVDDFQLRGTRPRDVAALGGDDPGRTWHHCADYGGGTCTMQQVDAVDHGSWGHRGGAAQSGMQGYRGVRD